MTLRSIHFATISNSIHVIILIFFFVTFVETASPQNLQQNSIHVIFSIFSLYKWGKRIVER